jgi:aryl-alcohol dehydrogenase-like predicted oxidoreductase
VCVQNSYALDSNREDDTFIKVCAERGVAFVPFFAIGGAAQGGGDRADAVRAIASTHGVSEQQIRLAWTLHQAPNVLAIPGTGNPAHLEENVAAGALKLSAAELAVLNG